MIKLTLPAKLEDIKTKSDIDNIVKEFYDYISAKPFEIMANKDINKFDEDEEEQLIRMIMVYHCILGHRLKNTLEVPSNYGKSWVDKTNETLYRKMLAINKQYKNEFDVLAVLKQWFEYNYNKMQISIKKLKDADYQWTLDYLRLRESIEEKYRRKIR